MENITLKIPYDEPTEDERKGPNGETYNMNVFRLVDDEIAKVNMSKEEQEKSEELEITGVYYSSLTINLPQYFRVNSDFFNLT